MLCLTCTIISSVDLANYGVSRAKDLVSVDCSTNRIKGWPGGAMVLGKHPVSGRPTNLDYSRARAGGGCLDIFSLAYHFSLLSPSLWETARYRLKSVLSHRAVKPKTTNQPNKQTNRIMAPNKQEYLSLKSRLNRVCPSFCGVVGWCDGAG